MAPKSIPMSALTPVIATATRGPDDKDLIAKLFGAAVIRSWINGWVYGARTELPFVVLPEAWDHYHEHILKAATELGLFVIYLTPKEYSRFRESLHYLGCVGSTLSDSLPREAVSALHYCSSDEELETFYSKQRRWYYVS